RRRHDARRAGQRDVAAAVLHLRDRLPVLGFRVRGRADHGPAGAARRNGARAVRLPRAADSLPVALPMSASTHVYEPAGAALAIALPYMASAFGIFLLRQTFKTVPRELDEAARVEGCSPLQTLWRVYVPLARPTYLAYALVSVSYHWNNFLWPLIITNSVETRPVTVGLQVFSSTDQGIDWSIISAGTLMAVAPLLVAFLLFQRQFMQSFMQA